MKGKLVKDISAGTIQVICNQAMGVLIFIIISRYLDKEIYGALNWSLAVLVFVTTILSLRLEQVVVRKVAAGEDSSKMLTIFFGHIFFSGLLFYAVLLFAKTIFPAFFKQHDLLLLIGISQLLSFFSLPFKQVAAGKEAFAWLAVMSSVSNMIRAVWLLLLILFSVPTITQVITIYIVSSLAELLVNVYIVQSKLNTGIRMRWAMKDYFILITESLPQIGVVFLNACIGRIDWILMGILSTKVITAEYSFAYRVFELSPIPMVILGPVLLSRFSRGLSNHGDRLLKEREKELHLLIRAEMILATLLPLLLNIAWTPLVGLLTHNKYGEVNKTTFFILSLTIPFQYLINLLWTIRFSQNQLARIFRVTAITCLVIVLGDLVMIPLMNARGAALVYLLAMVVEFLVYFKGVDFIGRRNVWQPLFTCLGIALLTGWAADHLAIPIMAKLALAVLVYAVLLVVTGQLQKKDIPLIRHWM